ncbi:MAG: site-2 protease family protein [Bacillota bacterium]
MIRDPMTLLLSVPGLLLALTFHELAHGYVADSLGDPTPRASGRLSLNPLVHLDLVGTLMLLMFRFGWAKPVPINPMYFRDRDRGLLLTSLAGPASNVLMACIAMYSLLQFPTLRFSTAGTMVYYFLLYNIFLAVFNMLPIPPLDGSRVLSALIPQRSPFRRVLYQLEQYGWLILMLLVLTRTITAIMGPAAAALERFIVFVVSPLVM